MVFKFLTFNENIIWLTKKHFNNSYVVSVLIIRNISLACNLCCPWKKFYRLHIVIKSCNHFLRRKQYVFILEPTEVKQLLRVVSQYNWIGSKVL